MQIDEQLLRNVVTKVMQDIQGQSGSVGSGRGVFSSMDEAVAASDSAWQQYIKCSMKDRERYINAIRSVVLQPENLEYMSKAAVEETGMGNVESKLIKNRLAAENSPGIEDLTTRALSGDDGLTLEEYCPFGVIGAITPATNPSETIICNSIGMLAGGNTVVFSPHPRASALSAWLVSKINDKLIAEGAPENLVTTVSKPSIEQTNALMSHPSVRMLVATGGPGIVKMVLSSGKKAIGAGAGNPPVVVDETADLVQAARNIIDGCSFDNNLPCTAEKEVVAVQSIADTLIENMTESGAWLMSDSQMIERMWELVSNDKGGPNVDFVGKSAQYILDCLGIKVNGDVKVILLEANSDSPFVQEEMMMPILPVVRADNVDRAIEMAKIFEKGNRHTAIMHSKNVDKLTKMARELQTTIFVKNAPSYAGIGVGGEGCTTFTIAGPTGEGLTSAKSFCRIRRCVMNDALNIR